MTPTEVAIQNLKRLLRILPMIEEQRNTIEHAIKVLRETGDVK